MIIIIIIKFVFILNLFQNRHDTSTAYINVFYKWKYYGLSYDIFLILFKNRTNKNFGKTKCFKIIYYIYNNFQKPFFIF